MMITCRMARKTSSSPLIRKKYQETSSNPLASGGRARPPPRLCMWLPHSVEQRPCHQDRGRDKCHKECDDHAVEELTLDRDRAVPEVNQDDAQPIERVVVQGRDQHDLH